ncbi:hypothetical protein P691DRAFT_17727 [Macrolepiota fuliginosa MF-IS2]|uniref:Protein kinase domain-containing protein n=1 Tax=Macrolepiota fuliginosa MF-IS2 TaxID=1400762 RepID=A0A9P5XSX0_9AGAR|nr:hypothetical protein P691DRAFT_17727 [Macrolepiota fuliginosa MF-IS2]
MSDNKARRVLYVANPGSESDEGSDEDRRRALHGRLGYPTHRRPPPSNVPPYGAFKVSQSFPQPPTLTTNFTPNNTQYQASHPPLSSPSTSSSPAAEESTPPPSTPAVPVPHVDLPGGTNTAPEMVISSSTSDRGVIDVPQSSTARVAKHLPPAKPAFGSRGPRQADAAARRPKTSPTVPTPDSYTSPSSNSSLTPVGERVLIVVTSDSERFVTVDVSGAPDPAFIRECIFSKLNIYTEEEQAQFSIFQTEIGDYQMGKSLSDEKLFALCRDHGDSKGSLKFFVTHTPVPEPEHSPRPPPQLPPQQPLSTIPPVLSTHIPVTPLRPGKRRPRSRHGSVSSAASEHPYESATGYEADLDNPEKESHRSTLRPSQQGYINSSGPPPSPQHRRLNNSSAVPQPSQSPLHLPRSLSPPTPQLPPPPSLPAQTTFTDKYGQILPTPPPPPPLSPARAKFPINDDSTFLPPPQSNFRHGRSGSDAAAEREQAFINSEQQQLEDVARWKASRQQLPPPNTRPVLRSEPTRDVPSQLPQAKEARQRKRTPTDVDDWQHVSPPGRDYDPSPSSISGSSQFGEPNGNGNSRISPSMGRKPINQTSPRARPTSPYTTRPLIPPAPRTQPPPVPPHSSETRSTQRSAGIPVPTEFLVRWKGETKVGGPSAFSRLGRVNTKSMDSLRSSQNLQSGTQRRANALPVSRSSRDHLAFSPSGLSGTPKSYENSSRLPINNTRPPPTQYNGPESSMSPQQSYLRNNMPYSNSNTIISTSLSISSNNTEPYPRPQSATGDKDVTSPSNPKYNGRQMHSPTYGPTLEPFESARSPRATSPSRSYHHSTIIPGPRPRPGTADRSLDSYNSGFETSHSTPPRSPVTPQSPRRDADERDFKIVDDTSPRTYVPDRSSEDTLKQEEHSRLMQMMRNLSVESTVVPRINTAGTNGNLTTISITTTAASTPPSRVSSPPLSATSSAIYDMYHDESSDTGGGNGTWIRKPPAQLQGHMEEKPKLKVQIEASGAKQSPSSAEKSNPSTGSTGSTATLLALPSLSNLRANSNMSVASSSSSHGSSTKVGGLSEMMLMHEKDERGRERERERESELEWQREQERERATTTETFVDDKDGWALRPPPEAVYERLEHYFRGHDLDKPVIEATSGGTSPTSTEPVAPPPAAPSNIDREREKARTRSKKSIRYVAEDAKRRIDRTSKADSMYSSTFLKRRNTKFWGGKLEEVTTHQAKSSSAGSASSSSPDSPSSGSDTFKWVRGELIGKGTYGRVYLAMNATTGEMIAVKQVELPQTASDKYDSRQHTVVQALKMESETLKDLDHPNIVQYLGFEETTDNLSIFLEYVPGGSIGSCLHKHGRFHEDVTKSFTSQILSGLEYLHDRGILHRDLKADNILVEMSGTCKISDFGISKRTDDEAGGAFTAMQGTVFWMAPEVINTQKKGYNFKIDIWSVGCVVLEMWAGMRPWMGEEMVAVMFKLYQNKLPPPVPDDVHLSLLADDFRTKCFAINPEERPSAAVLRKHEYLALPPGWQFNGFT